MIVSMSVRRASVTGSGNRYNQEPPRRILSPVGGVGPYAREAQTGGKQREWTWMSYRGRKALGPESSGRNRQQQGNGYGGSCSRGDRFD